MSSAFLLPELLADKARATSGLPALSPARRVSTAYREKQAFKQRVMIADAQGKQLNAVAPDGDRPTTSTEAQLGRPLTSAEIIKRLEKLNPNLLFERSLADPSTMGIYLPDSRVSGGRRFLLGFEFGYSPEFTINHANEKGQFVKETRGWRQIIVRLARAGHISLAAAERLFQIARGPQSKHWHTLTN